MQTNLQLISNQKTISSQKVSNSTIKEDSISHGGIMAVIRDDNSVKNEITRKINDFNILGINKGTNAQVDVSRGIITENVVMHEAFETMAVTLEEYQEEAEERELRIKAYEMALGRKISEEEYNEFLVSFIAPALVVDKKKVIFDKLMKNVNSAKQITKT